MKEFLGKVSSSFEFIQISVNRNLHLFEYDKMQSIFNLGPFFPHLSEHFF